MQTSHVVLGVGAAAIAAGAGVYFYNKSKKASGKFYPGAQGIPTTARSGAPQNSSGVPTGGTKGSEAAQLVGAAAPILIAALPHIFDLFGGEPEPSSTEPTSSIEGLDFSEFDPAYGI